MWEKEPVVPVTLSAKKVFVGFAVVIVFVAAVAAAAGARFRGNEVLGLVLVVLDAKWPTTSGGEPLLN